MITIKESKTAESRTCGDPTKVSKRDLLVSTEQHRSDVSLGLSFFQDLMYDAAIDHDYDKLNSLDQFHHDFQTGFSEHTWWDQHKVNSRHHLLAPEGVPEDVNLVDVLEFVVDCVMAGMARCGSVYDLSLSDELLQRAFKNTVEMLKREVVVEKEVGDVQD